MQNLKSSAGGSWLWHANTYKQESTLNYGYERVWTLAALPGTNYIALGYDEGTIVIKIGKELPLATFSNGKVVWVKQNDVSTFNLKLLAGADEASKDGEKVTPQNIKEMGVCETFS